MPTFPSITSCSVIARNASGEGHYVTEFANSNNMIITRKLTSSERKESSTFHKCLVVHDTYSSPLVSGAQFKNSQVINFTDNQGVILVFTISSPKKHLQSMAVKV